MRYSRAELEGLVFDVDTTQKLNVRDLQSGDWFIHVRDSKKRAGNALLYSMYKLSANPFKAETVLGSTITVYPSDVVYRARLVEPEVENDA